MSLIFLPGLGYDARIFSRLPQAQEAGAQFLNWIEALPGESPGAYAQRWVGTLENSPEKAILIGHSFGGVMAQEIASFTRVSGIVLISSLCKREQLPITFRLIAPLGLERLFTRELCSRTVKYWGKAHDLPHAADQDLFRSMVNRYSNRTLQWSLRQLSTWHPPALSPELPVVHLHGSKDKTLPPSRRFPPDHEVEGASHVMVYQQAQQVGSLLDAILSTI